ncbi:MAG: Uma2 family endonuclease [Gemmatimonadota bacterium]
MPTPHRRAYYMAMPLTLPHYTIADLDRIPADGNRYEVLAGMLLVTPGAGGLHQSILSRLFAEITYYLRPVGLAYAVSPGGILSGSDTRLEPDLLVIPSRYFGVDWREMSVRWLAVEVSGRSSRVHDRDYKRNAYLDLGVREVWRVDLRDRVIYVSRPGDPPDQPQDERLEWYPPEMPGPLVLDVPALFQGYQPSNWS